VRKVLKISNSKTEYIECEFRGRNQEVDGTRKTMTINYVKIGKVEIFNF